MELHTLSLKQAIQGLKKKDFSSYDLTHACLSEIKKRNSELNAFITVCEKEALNEARETDDDLATGASFPLSGIPIAIKDMFLTKGIKTTAGSKVLENYIPQYNGTVVEKLIDAGTTIIGKTNQDAWAHGSSGENSDFGPTKNPWNTEYVPGGSSSGSAAAVASNMCIAAMATDTGGSIRQPASFCNVVGLKPTYGRVSRYGVVSMASSLDTIGHITKTVEDSAILLNITAGKDPFDATTPNKEVPDYTKTIQKSVKGLKIGVPKEYFIEGLDPQIEERIKSALKKYEELGAEIVDISLPHTQYAIEAYYIIQPSEVSSNLARYDAVRYGSPRENFGEEGKRRIMLGTFTLSAGYYDAYYKKAMLVRTLIKNDFDEAFKKVDTIITPVSPTLPWKLGEKTDNPLAMYLSDIFTVTANLSGIPGLSVPLGFIEGLPVGMQILGPHFSEELLFQVGYAYEQSK